jgi:N utilization substance protein B
MKTHFSPRNNPRVIIIQKLYGKIFNDEETISFPKHRFKKFIKDVVLGSIERSELIKDELDTKLGEEFSFKNLDKVFQIILTAATYEFLYKPNISINIIIKEYLNSSNFFFRKLTNKIFKCFVR